MTMTSEAAVVSTPAIFGLQELEAVFDRQSIIDAVRSSFIDHHNGRFKQASPVHLVFDKGECHVKSGFAKQGSSFLIKIASGFYGNDSIGIPSANGMMLLFSQETGAPIAIFQDEGMMTAWRTAAATLVAALAVPKQQPLKVGLIGAGLQAELAGQWLPNEAEVASIQVWTRSSGKAETLARKIGGTVAQDLETLCRTSNLIISATPSTTPLVMADWISPGTHIVALGADTPGKIEVDPVLFSRAALVLVDDHRQCADHGDFGCALRAAQIDESGSVELGAWLSDDKRSMPPTDGIVISDLTGLAIQDDAIAQLFLSRLSL